MIVRPISTRELPPLIRRRLRLAEAAGRDYIRDTAGFIAHLTGVAAHARAVAERLRVTLPADEAPDPVVAFVAGAWHDAGKAWSGDDYHEIASAREVLQSGQQWGLVRGPERHVRPILRRAAATILPHFALYEQWSPAYMPSSGSRVGFVPQYERLMQTLCPAALCDQRRRLLLPATIDALVLIYSDMMAPADGKMPCQPLELLFERRWRDLTCRAEREDPAIVPILPRVRPRIEAACALIQQFLTRGYDAAALRRFRATLRLDGVIRNYRHVVG